MKLGKLATLGPVILVLTLFGSAYAIYTLTVGQTVNVVAAPFTATITGASCTGSTTITCQTGTLAVNATETLTATITFVTQNSVVFTASSSNTSVATISPLSGTITSTSQIFTVTALAVGSTTITLTFR